MNDPTRRSLGTAPGLERYDKANGQATYRLRVREDGKQRSIPIVASTDVQAAAEAWRILAAIEAGAGGETVLDLLPEYLRRVELAESTKGLYRHRIETFGGRLLEKPMAEVTVGDLREWLTDLRELRHDGKPYSRNAQHGCRVAMASIFRYAARVERIAASPFDRLDRDDSIRGRDRTERPRTLPLATIDAVADELDPETRALVRLMARTGLRSSEARGARWEDFDLARREYQLRQQVSLTGELVSRLKTVNSGRRTPLLTPARDELVRWKAESDRSTGLLFRNAGGGPIERSRFRRRLIKASAAAGVSPAINPHLIRHSFVASLAAAGASIADTALLARDHERTIEAHYDGQVNERERADRVALLAFGGVS